MKSHPKRGFEICQPLKSLEESLTCIRSHHERYDGGGYPDGLKGDDIPLCGMILAVADTYDAMTTDRPYRKALAKETAVKILEDEINSGQWNPDIVRVFLQILKVS
ncbi:MAG: HD domain-containing protein [Deltaproteobacteria bacterium]|nr:HD domain-containing protein [Deltaproteobacteria bacterium]